MRLVACLKADLQVVFDALMREDQFEVVLNKSAFSKVCMCAWHVLVCKVAGVCLLVCKRVWMHVFVMCACL